MVFLCDNVSIVIIQEKVELAVFQIPFFYGFCAWGMELPTICLCAMQLAFSCMSLLHEEWLPTGKDSAAVMLTKHYKGLNLSSLSLSAVTAASSIPPELNIVAAHWGGA